MARTFTSEETAEAVAAWKKQGLSAITPLLEPFNVETLLKHPYSDKVEEFTQKLKGNKAHLALYSIGRHYSKNNPGNNTWKELKEFSMWWYTNCRVLPPILLIKTLDIPRIINYPLTPEEVLELSMYRDQKTQLQLSAYQKNHPTLSQKALKLLGLAEPEPPHNTPPEEEPQPKRSKQAIPEQQYHRDDKREECYSPLTPGKPPPMSSTSPVYFLDSKEAETKSTHPQPVDIKSSAPPDVNAEVNFQYATTLRTKWAEAIQSTPCYVGSKRDSSELMKSIIILVQIYANYSAEQMDMQIPILQFIEETPCDGETINILKDYPGLLALKKTTLLRYLPFVWKTMEQLEQELSIAPIKQILKGITFPSPQVQARIAKALRR